MKIDLENDLEIPGKTWSETPLGEWEPCIHWNHTVKKSGISGIFFAEISGKCLRNA